MRNDIKIEADTALIALTQGQFAKVDPRDLPLLAGYSWHAVFIYNTFYAAASCSVARRRVYMHRVITDAPAGMEVDHINSDRLDNRRANLRVVSHAENQKNIGRNRANTSGVKGVYWDRTRKKWHAQISVEDKIKFLGRFNTLEEGRRAYEAASAKYHGEFGRTR